MNYDNLVQEMLRIIPDLKHDYDKEIEWYDNEIPGPHIVFGDIFNPYLLELLKNSVKQEQLLARVFNFLEEMAISTDLMVQEVLSCTVLERLGDNPNILEKAKRYMMLNTTKLSEDVEKGWGRN